LDLRLLFNNEKIPKKYRIESTRLKHWDYSNPGMYFITICTHNFVEWFGTINDRKFGPLKKGSLSTIVGSYKSAVTRTIQKTESPDFNGNPRFYDHVVRNEIALENIQHYIIQNPAN